jgi:hypothetical protein
LVPSTSSHTYHSGSTPKMDFPKFDGVNPRLWRDRSESYLNLLFLLFQPSVLAAPTSDSPILVQIPASS